MKNNNDPIQEFKPFRFGIENPTEDTYKDNDFHNCSNDLSEEGSIKEELEHSQFAKYKKQAFLNNYIQQNNQKASMNIDNMKAKICIIIVVIYIIYMLVSVVKNVIFNTFTAYKFANTSGYEEYVDIEKIQIDKEALFEASKSNIIVNSIPVSDGSIILNVKNANYELFNNIEIETIFYDVNNKPLKICENNIDTLYGNSNYLCKISETPENYDRIDFLVTQPYIIETENVDYTYLDLRVAPDSEGDFDISITNNTYTDIDSLEIVAIYYKNGEIIDIDTNNVYDIEANKTVEDIMYNFKDMNSYDDVKFMINDVTIY